MLEVINYIILGLIWALIWEQIEWKHNNREMNNQERFVHVTLWPIWATIFIIGWLKGVFFDPDDE